MNREQILKNAITHTCGERDVEYGSPVINLMAIGGLWTAYLEGKYAGKIPGIGTTEETTSQFEITAEDVAWLNVLQKMARTFSGNVKADTYEDAAAYAAIAGECAE